MHHNLAVNPLYPNLREIAMRILHGIPYRNRPARILYYVRPQTRHARCRWLSTSHSSHRRAQQQRCARVPARAGILPGQCASCDRSREKQNTNQYCCGSPYAKSAPHYQPANAGKTELPGCLARNDPATAPALHGQSRWYRTGRARDGWTQMSDDLSDASPA